jgi:hypothetical protein
VACTIGSANKVVLINIHPPAFYVEGPLWLPCNFLCINRNLFLVSGRFTWLGAPSLLASNFFTKSIGLLTTVDFFGLPQSLHHCGCWFGMKKLTDFILFNSVEEQQPVDLSTSIS